MSTGTVGPLPLKGGVCVVPTSTVAWRERVGDEGDQGAASFVDIGVKMTWVAHRGALSRRRPGQARQPAWWGPHRWRPGRSRAEHAIDSSGRNDTTFLSAEEDGGDAPFEGPHTDRNRRRRAQIRRPSAQGRSDLAADGHLAT
jgi:hypothetical protein